MRPTDGFVSGRSNDRFTPTVTIHSVPFPVQLLGRSHAYPFQKLERKIIVSHAVQARDESEAQKRHKKTEKEEATQKKGRKRTASRFALPDPSHGCNEPYELDPQVRRMRNAVTRVRDRMKQIDSLYETIVKPNRAQRREYDAIMRRMRHEIDMVA